MNTNSTYTRTTIRPGLLVSLSTNVRGNVMYKRTEIEEDHITEEGKRKAAWQTDRTITDPQEHERAEKVRSKIGSTIRGVCTKSANHLLCPIADEDKLNEAVAEARRLADDFNRTSSLSKVTFTCMTGRVAANEVDAINSINQEVRELLADMAQGVEKMDVKAIREAADRAKELNVMLVGSAQAAVTVAVQTARSAARQITKAQREGGEPEIDPRAAAKIAEMQSSFLDLDDAQAVAAPVVQSRALDFDAADTGA